ncbi:MAG: hypothetical protein Q9203_001560 [Teloschistes exilis]
MATPAAAADTTAPVITVRAPASNSVSLGDYVTTTIYVGTAYNDAGAVAFDNIDGNITSSLSAYGIGAVSTSKPTGNSYFIITYTVQQGNIQMSVCRGASATDALDGVLTPYVQACSNGTGK